MTKFRVRKEVGDGTLPLIIDAKNSTEAAKIFADKEKFYSENLIVTCDQPAEYKVCRIARPSIVQSTITEIAEVEVELPMVDLAKIAKVAVSKFPLHEYFEVIDCLFDDKARMEVISELNQKIRSEYRALITKKITQKKGFGFNLNLASASIQKLTEQSMELGAVSILKTKIKNENKPANKQISSSEIIHKGTWEELKRRL